MAISQNVRVFYSVIVVTDITIIVAEAVKKGIESEGGKATIYQCVSLPSVLTYSLTAMKGP